jgi:hypothetical protein
MFKKAIILFNFYTGWRQSTMEKKRGIEKKDLGFIIGGAVLGAIAGYIINRVGIKNIMSMLKQKEIIPPSISNLIKEFSSGKKSS